MKLPRSFAIFLAIVLLCLSLAAAIPTQTTESLESSGTNQEYMGNTESVDMDQIGNQEEESSQGQQQQMELLDNMSNAQRMARGLPLRKPGHLFNSRLGARAPAASENARLRQRDSL